MLRYTKETHNTTHAPGVARITAPPDRRADTDASHRHANGDRRTVGSMWDYLWNIYRRVKSYWSCSGSLTIRKHGTKGYRLSSSFFAAPGLRPDIGFLPMPFFTRCCRSKSIIRFESPLSKASQTW